MGSVSTAEFIVPGQEPPAAVASGTLKVRIVRSSGLAEVTFRGEVSDAHAQRIRNVIGSVPLARLVNAKRK